MEMHASGPRHRDTSEMDVPAFGNMAAMALEKIGDPDLS
jgi:hypothetical protein